MEEAEEEEEAFEGVCAMGEEEFGSYAKRACVDERGAWVDSCTYSRGVCVHALSPFW